MSKLILEPIQPDGPGGSAPPPGFLWRGRRYRLTQVGGSWTQGGRWWRGEGEREFVRALTDRNLVVDLCFEPAHGRWLLYQVLD